MIRILLALFCLLAAVVALAAVCDLRGGMAAPGPIVAPRPIEPAPISIPNPVHNYMSGAWRHKQGSCLHAAVQDLLRWQGLGDKADYWRSHFGGAADLAEVVQIAEQLGLHHAETASGEEGFLEFVAGRRLGAAIYWEVEQPGDHAIVFCGYDGADAILLGTNRVETTRMPRAEFLRQWHRCGGVAFTILP